MSTEKTPAEALAQLIDIVEFWLENEEETIRATSGNFAADDPRAYLEDNSDPFGEVERFADTVEALKITREQLT